MFNFNQNKIYVGKNGKYIHCANDYGQWYYNATSVYRDTYFISNNSYHWDLSSNQSNFDAFTKSFE